MELIIKNLSYTYPYTKGPALKEVNLVIKEKGLIGLLGPSGSGKSTLFQLMKALIMPDQGEILINEASYLKKDSLNKNIQKEVGLVFQFPENQFFADSVFEEVAFALRREKLSKSEIAKRVNETLKSLGLNPEEYIKRSPFSLSGGEMRRIALASILISRPKLLLLDQPFTGLDGNGKKELTSILRDLVKTSIELIIIISHQTDLIMRLCSKVILMEEGKLVRVDEVFKVMKNHEILQRLDLKQPWLFRVAKTMQKRGIRFDDETLNWATIKKKMAETGEINL